MAINNNNAASDFTYSPGGNKMGDITERLGEVCNYLGSSPIYQSTVANFGYLITLPPVHPLPTGVPTGSVAISGSNATTKLYIFIGANNTNNGWVSASIGG